MPRLMGRDDERRLVAALATVADGVNDGLDPDAAVEKAAQRHNVPAGHVPLMVHAYNIGRTTRQREEGSTPAEKAADFPLADAAIVLERLYPARVKSAAEHARATAISPEYYAPPDWYTQPRALAGARLLLTKTAAPGDDFPGAAPGAFAPPPGAMPNGPGAFAPDGAMPNGPGAFAPGGALPDDVFAPMPAAPRTPPPATPIDAAGLLPPGFRAAAPGSGVRLNPDVPATAPGAGAAPGIMAQLMEQAHAHPRIAAGLIGGAAGLGAYGLSRLLHGRRRDDEEKQGSEEWRLRRIQADGARRKQAVAEARRGAAQARDRLVEKLAALEDYFRVGGNRTLADVRGNVEALHGRAGTLVLDQVAARHPTLAKRAGVHPHHGVFPGDEPYATLDAVMALSGALSEAQASHEKTAAQAAAADAAVATMLRDATRPPSVLADDAPVKRADIKGGIGWAVGEKSLGAVGRGLVPPDTERMVARTLASIATPEHENELASIEARAHLYELLNHDEVLRGHDPHEVAHHYNQLSAFAPTVARHPLMTVPLVRTSVQQGQHDMFNAKEIADVEGKLRGFRAPGAAAQPEKEHKRASASVLAD